MFVFFCRSRTHNVRTDGIETLPDDDLSIGSDQEQDHEMNSNSTGLDVVSFLALNKIDFNEF